MSRSMTAAVFAAAVFALPMAAAAQGGEAAAPAPAAGQKAAPAAKSALDRRVCKTIVPTGTRLSKGRACKTAREWQQQTDDDRNTLNRMQKIPDNRAG